jgi:NAD(P)-dependent dehydrogenase (short-subunit alcohol dehydrogenase family)
MSGTCRDKVVIVTGAGGGIGRFHALEFAKQGAKVVVNDRGVAVDGNAQSEGPAAQVVEEIRAAGGEAIADVSDVADMGGAESLINAAVDTYGRLDVLVNNAGIIRDRTVANMTEAEWDDVIRVHLKGTFAPTHFASRYWRDQHKQGRLEGGRIVNTTSTSGLFGNIGQSNYGAAKAGIAGFTVITAMELHRYGVKVNAVAPGARTRMTDGLIPEEQGDFDPFDPAAIAPFVVWLGSDLAGDTTGQVIAVNGGSVTVLEGWRPGPKEERQSLFTVEEVDRVLPGLLANAYTNPRLPQAASGVDDVA